MAGRVGNLSKNTGPAPHGSESVKKHFLCENWMVAGALEGTLLRLARLGSMCGVPLTERDTGDLPN